MLVLLGNILLKKKEYVLHGWARSFKTLFNMIDYTNVLSFKPFSCVILTTAVLTFNTGDMIGVWQEDVHSFLRTSQNREFLVAVVSDTDNTGHSVDTETEPSCFLSDVLFVM